MKKAMKKRDKVRQDVLRMLLSEIKYAQSAVSMNTELEDHEVTNVVASYHKKLEKSLKDYPQGEHYNTIKKELEIIEEYLPQKLPIEEVEKIISQVINRDETKNFGSIMKSTLKIIGPMADAKKISQIIKSKLGE